MSLSFIIQRELPVYHAVELHGAWRGMEGYGGVFGLANIKSPRLYFQTERFAHHHKGNLKLQALLISAYSHYDPQRAEEVSRNLPAFQGSSRALDPDQLEKVPLFRQSRRPAERVEVRAIYRTQECL